MSNLWFIVDQLRTLIGLPAKSGMFRGIRFTPACDIERARWKRSMRESAAASAATLRRYRDHLDGGGSGIGFLLSEYPEMLEPPAPRPIVYSPELYRMLKVRAGASLRPPRRSAT